MNVWRQEFRKYIHPDDGVGTINSRHR
ncbi:hypothetical protein CBM2587_A10148 [Cupriavidus taiwanensis]|uniref:Uncharacterized protein n=1 Tax=Cupriavidus taiwanensis TaxID=164546 RepID=A0A375BBV9_9BURK|nr:hypothetical protein CBM2587_A10148 [Cupriavidus taiwanensis]